MRILVLLLLLTGCTVTYVSSTDSEPVTIQQGEKHKVDNEEP